MDQELPREREPEEESYNLSEGTLLIAAVIVLAVVLVVACIHLYARWHLLRRRRRRRSQSHIVFYAAGNRLRPAVDRGLDPSVLNSLPLFLYSSSSAAEEEERRRPSLDCAVCLSEFEENDVVRLLPKCGHSFHVDCIGMWLHSHSTCPLCRSSIEPVVNPVGLAQKFPDRASASDAGSSSAAGTGLSGQNDEGNSDTASFWGRRKGYCGRGLLGIRIETPAAPPPLDNEMSQSSSLLSLKRLLSVSRKPPAVSGGGRQIATAETGELGLESGLSELSEATRGEANSV
ncbi:RING-H2 finger protein ATL5-like [Andrographis paniculata]|uniref:RING-H2 finger protein ATL5-like n=1 Tax=Andrographis paniculata TaxID=175694 RepID=UPI0021E9968A|nr:RING-H2 finger protein ATL5-like [Andrographis paniculata]